MTHNIYIQDDAPGDYVPRYREALGEDELKRCCREHTLPEGFEHMDHDEFLGEAARADGAAGERGVREAVEAKELDIRRARRIELFQVSAEAFHRKPKGFYINSGTADITVIAKTNQTLVPVLK